MGRQMPLWKVVLVVVATAMITSGVRMQGCKLPGLPSIVAPRATAVVYVYEKDAGGIPNPIQAAFNALNRDTERGIRATFHEVDSTDGDSQIPDQYKVAVAAAREAGLPSAVVQSGDKVLRVVKSPKTEADVKEALE